MTNYDYHCDSGVSASTFRSVGLRRYRFVSLFRLTVNIVYLGDGQKQHDRNVIPLFRPLIA